MAGMITLLHTADAHVARFDALADELGIKLTHVVRADLLARAQNGMADALMDDVKKAALRADLCTCTTLGPVAGIARIDQPMMAKAAALDGPILMAYALDSTYAPSMDLLDQELAATGSPQKVHPLNLTEYWPLFEAGEQSGFDIVIAREVEEAVKNLPQLTCVVLAQVSMAGAADYLKHLKLPVLTSPRLALENLISK